MGRRKKEVKDPKQLLLSSTLKLLTSKKSKEIVKTKTSPTKVTTKGGSKKPVIYSPLKSPSRRRGRPKPQAKASAKLKSSLSSDESFSEKLDESFSEKINNNNNNNNNNNIKNEKHHEDLSNNNNVSSKPSRKENSSKSKDSSLSPNKNSSPTLEKNTSSRSPNKNSSPNSDKNISSRSVNKNASPNSDKNSSSRSPNKNLSPSPDITSSLKKLTSPSRKNKNSPSPNKTSSPSPTKSISPSSSTSSLSSATSKQLNHNENEIDGSKILLPNRSTNPPSKSTPKLGEGENPNEVKCKVCKQWFPNRYFQRKHMLMEHEDQLYECRVCSFNSVDPEKLKSHIIKLHVTKKEKSESVSLDNLQDELEKLIDKKIPRKVMMEDGVTLGRDVNSKMRYVCALCNRIYTSKYSLERHVRCHTLEKPYHCDVCSFTSSYREHMMRHMTSVHLIVHSNVPKIKYVPKKKREAPDSPGEEEGEESQVGSPEGSTADGNDENSPKKRRNILRERFECAVCGMRATHKTDLVDHIKAKHPNAHIESLENFDGSKVHLIVTVAKKPKPTKRLTIQCSYCFLIFHDTWKYKVHLRSHTGVKPFECSLCEMRATSKMTVRDHIHRKHKGSLDAKIILRTVSIDGSVEKVELPVPWREFKCEQCNEQFNDNYNLKLHKQKKHRDTLPFFCLICSHKELTKAGMVVHCTSEHKNEDLDSIIMRNGKPCRIGPINLPTCDFCNKTFSYRSQLNIHMKIHTGEKSFSCEHCNYKTNLKKYLINHVEKAHFPSDEQQEKKRKVRKTRTPKSPKSPQVH